MRTSEGNPIPGAELRGNFCFDGPCLHHSKVLAVTGGDGRFRVEDLPQSSGTFFVRYPSFAESISDQVTSGDTSPTVQFIKSDSAAGRAGLPKGDRLLKINGTRVDGLLAQEINTLLCGAPATSARLQVQRQGSEIATEITYVWR